MYGLSIARSIIEKAAVVVALWPFEIWISERENHRSQIDLAEGCKNELNFPQLGPI